MAPQLTFEAKTLTLCGQSLTDRVMRSASSVQRFADTDAFRVANLP